MSLLFEALPCREPNKMCMYPKNCTRRQECLSKHQEKPMEKKERHGSPLFYALLEKMAETHNKKSHDYASNDNPFGNYHFAGMLSKLFDNPDDAGFIGRLGEKFYRLANLENNKKAVAVLDEGIEDTETDIVTITALWIVSRRERRAKNKERFTPRT